MSGIGRSNQETVNYERALRTHDTFRVTSVIRQSALRFPLNNFPDQKIKTMPSPTTLPPPTPISHPSPPSPSFYLIHDTIPHPWYDATLQTIRHCTLREQRGNHPLFPGGTKILHIKDWNEWKEVMRREGVSEGDVLCGVGVGGLVVLRWLEECKAAGVVLVDVSVAGDGDLVCMDGRRAFFLLIQVFSLRRKQTPSSKPHSTSPKSPRTPALSSSSHSRPHPRPS